MLRGLKAVCFVFTGTVVLFVLVNLVIAYLYPRDPRAVTKGHPIFKDATRATYERIYQLPIDVARETVAECFMEDAWIFEPYVQFRERPRRGNFVNIAPEGFRLNVKDGRTTFDPTVKAVFILGGSTTFGYGVRDQDTIAAHLEAIFRERRPDQKVPSLGRGKTDSTADNGCYVKPPRGGPPQDALNAAYAPLYALGSVIGRRSQVPYTAFQAAGSARGQSFRHGSSLRESVDVTKVHLTALHSSPPAASIALTESAVMADTIERELDR